MRYWRAANYLSVGQIYLLDNPLLQQPLAAEHVKPRLLGHWGTTPGLNLLYAHLNRRHPPSAMPTSSSSPDRGTAGRAWSANAYLEGTYSEVYTAIGQDTAGLQKTVPPVLLPRRDSQPRGAGDARARSTRAVSSATRWCMPTAPRSTTRISWWPPPSVGDGEAETGPLAASWHSNKFLDPVRDGAVLPILHLNGYKIANPTVLARIPADELDAADARIRLRADHRRRRRTG